MKNVHSIFRTILVLIFVSILMISCQKNSIETKPNVILIMTDDQGYGDFGITGNPIIETPNLDAMAKRSAQMTNYYVSPVCAPTRASLMTGRYNYRTRVVDTFLGRAMMETNEVTVAEILRDAGYSTGIFGKWHLGDSYPMRPQDQGFEEVLVHRGGGIGQESDPPGGEGKYTDPILFHNGEQVQERGYCTDIYFTRAMEWIKKAAEAKKPFFAYVATNAPHTPVHDVPDALYQKYKAMNLANDQFPQKRGHPLTNKEDLDRRARIYAMITNIDDNIGRFFKELERQGLAQNTLVIFMVDNGPNGQRYVVGHRGHKTTVYEGGIKSPLFLHWPDQLNPDMSSDEVVVHIDILPTILEACQVSLDPNVKIDGRSFLQILNGKETEWEDRTLVLQSHRGNKPFAYNNFALRTKKWKLLHASGYHGESFEGAPKFELYNMVEDPLEMNNLAASEPEILNRLKSDYDKWFKDVSNTRMDNYTPPRIPIGTAYENPVVLTRQDWQQVFENPWLAQATGYWRLVAEKQSDYTITVRFRGKEKNGSIYLKIGENVYQHPLIKGQQQVLFTNIKIGRGSVDLQAWLQVSQNKKFGSWQVEVERN